MTLASRGFPEGSWLSVPTLFLKEVPRTPDNMAGLTVVDGTFPESV
jgi:hypothetical protein